MLEIRFNRFNRYNVIKIYHKKIYGIEYFLSLMLDWLWLNMRQFIPSPWLNIDLLHRRRRGGGG